MAKPTLRQRVAAWLLKANERPWSAWYSPGMAATSTWSYGNYASDGYSSNPYVYRCVRLLASSAAGIDPLVYRATRGGELEEVSEGHELLRLVASPNPTQGWAEWLDELLSYYLVGGQSFSIAVGPTRGKNITVRELWNLQPDSLAPLVSERIGEVVGFRYEAGSKRVDYTPEEVFWLRAFDPLSQTQGMPPAAAARYAIDANTAALNFNRAMLENGGVPGALIKSKRVLTDEEASTALRQFNLEFGGAANAGKNHLVSGEIDIVPFGSTPKEMSWDALIESTATQTAIAFGVPPQLVGAKGQLTYSNLKEARAALYTEAVLPLLDRFYQAFSRYVSARFSGGPYVITYDTDDIEALREGQGEQWARVAGAWQLTVDEKREALGYEPMPIGGDVVLVPTGMVPLEAVTGAPIPTETVE